MTIFNVYDRQNVWYKEYQAFDTQLVANDVHLMGLAVNALNVAYRSIVRRLRANLRDDETRPFLMEIWELVTQLANFVTRVPAQRVGNRIEVCCGGCSDD